jgi:hypothetical protein
MTMIQANAFPPGYQVHKTQDGGTAIQGVWHCEGVPYIDGAEVKKAMRKQVKARLQDAIPADLVQRRDKARRLVAACRQDLNTATIARREAVSRLQSLWADIADLAAIKSAEDDAAQADARINAVSGRLRLAEEKLGQVSGELGTLLEKAVAEIYREPAPITERHRKAEVAVQMAMEKHVAILSEAAAVRWFWFDATKRQDGHRSGFLDLAREVLAAFEHGDQEPEAATEPDLEPVADLEAEPATVAE